MKDRKKIVLGKVVESEVLKLKIKCVLFILNPIRIIHLKNRAASVKYHSICLKNVSFKYFENPIKFSLASLNTFTPES